MPDEEVAIDDKLTSKLEVALFLAKWLILGEFILFAVALGIWVGGTAAGIPAEAAESAVGILLPITTGNIGALIGYILGKNRIENGTVTE